MNTRPGKKFLKNVFCWVLLRDGPFAHRRATLKNHFLKGSTWALSLPATTFFVLPHFAFAQGVFDLIDDLLGLIDVIIPVLIGCAVAVFFWGLVKFIAHADDEKSVTEGKQFMLWGMIGIFVIVALWSIIGFVQNEFGLNASGIMTAPSLPTSLPML